MSEDRVIHRPSPEQIASSPLTALREHFAGRVAVADDAALQRFALEQPARFWDGLATFLGLELAGEREPVIEGEAVETARFFPNAALSYVAHLLRSAQSAPDRVAVIAVDERGERVTLTFGELDRRVRRVAAALERRGLARGDRVFGWARNSAETLLAYLATLSLGAIWSSAAPDMGNELLLSRAGQTSPKLLFADPSYPYHGALRDNRPRIAEVVGALGSVTRVVSLGDAFEVGGSVEAETLRDLLDEPGEPLAAYPALPFNHPLLILFSSGTTGAPKCIVHGAGGTLLEHLKELGVHSGLGPGKRILFHTTTGWMMYNWLVSALGVGATIVLYDGSVSFPEADALLGVVAREQVTHFGTSPAYLSYCEGAELVPRERHDFGALLRMLSTGSVLSERMVDYALASIKQVPIESISGGTDIVGCFVLGSPNQAVIRGRSPALSLGLDVRAAVTGPSGTQLLRAPSEGFVSGELVCAAPFPSRPLGLWGDEDGSRFHAAYFAEHEGVWTHGDHLELHADGSARILGRSDGVLNIRGVRIGPGEIYRIVSDFPEILASLAVEQPWASELGGSRLVLLVTLAEGAMLDRPLSLKLKKALKDRASPAHVPAVIVALPQLPMTHSGKLSERAARDALRGQTPKNLAALKNPETVDAIREHPELRAG